jgi:hypothetical protein
MPALDRQIEDVVDKQEQVLARMDVFDIRVLQRFLAKSPTSTPGSR